MPLKLTSYLRLVLCLTALYSQVTCASWDWRGSVLEDSMLRGFGIADNSSAHNGFVNPASLAFDADLYGSHFLIYGYGEVRTDHRPNYGASLSYGKWSLTSQKLGDGNQGVIKHSLSVSASLSPHWFWGLRTNLFKGQATFDQTLWGVDLGIQWRPLRWASFGVVAQNLNAPSLGGTRLSPTLSYGVTFKPFEKLDLSLNAVQFTATGFENWNLGAIANYALFPGTEIQLGFDSVGKVQVGLVVELGQSQTRLFSQTGSPSQLHLGAGVVPFHQPHPLLGQKETYLRVDSSLDSALLPKTFFTPQPPTQLTLLKQLQQAKKSPHPSTLYLKIVHFPLGYSSALEVAKQISSLRKQGIRVIAMLENAGIKEYLIASACEKIWMAPAGEIKFYGPSMAKYFLKGTLDKIGIKALIEKEGAYKSAPETLTQKQSSKESQQMTSSLLASIETTLLNLLAQHRQWDLKKFRRIQKLALLGPELALQEGIIDHIGNPVEDETPSTFKGPQVEVLKKADLKLPDQVAILYLDGDIMPSQSRWGLLLGARQVTSSQIEKLCQRALSDPRVKAVVVRIQSPGGEVFASRQLTEALLSLGEKIPVVVSMGDVAASGGYMAALSGRQIFVTPLTLTGSIGVFLGRASLEKLYDKIDLKKEVTGRGAYPSLMSEHRDWTDEEREVFLRRLDAHYTSFKALVSKWRKLSAEQVHLAAQGRVWTGEQALTNGLADQSGGFLAAIAYAASLGQVDPDFYEIQEMAPSPSWGGLLDLFGVSAQTSFWGKTLSPSTHHLLDELTRPPGFYYGLQDPFELE